MTNIFSLILLILILVTGIFWFFARFKLLSTRFQFLVKLGQKKQKTNTLIINRDITVSEKNCKLKWIEGCASIFPILLMVFVARSFIFEPFQIPSGSMMPTLLIGDFILVKKFAYGIKDPITRITLIKTDLPKRGDVVVFKYPLNPNLDYIKRIIGLPGDRINYDLVNKKITVQPNYTNEQDDPTTLSITYSNVSQSDFVQTFNLAGSHEISNYFLQSPSIQQVNYGIRLIQCQESLAGIFHKILIVPDQQDQLNLYFQQPGKSLAEWVVPPGEYFVMGDNRDNSADSRYWGFVPERNLVGKAVAIWMSFDRQAGKWPTGVRFKRIGSIH